MISACPHCQMQLELTPELQGIAVACPGCSRQFVTPKGHTGPSRPSPVIATHGQGHRKTEIKNSGVAAVCSFLWAGIGQVYNGQLGKGIAMALVQVIFLFLSFAVIGVPFFLGLWVWGVYDAYQQAEAINERGG